MNHAGIGLTELRVAFAIANAFMFFFPPRPILIAGRQTWEYFGP
jgi:hypothetical protein